MDTENDTENGGAVVADAVFPDLSVFLAAFSDPETILRDHAQFQGIATPFLQGLRLPAGPGCWRS